MTTSDCVDCTTNPRRYQPVFIRKLILVCCRLMRIGQWMMSSLMECSRQLVVVVVARLMRVLLTAAATTTNPLYDVTAL